MEPPVPRVRIDGKQAVAVVKQEGRLAASARTGRYFFLFTGGARNDTLSPAAGSAACGSPRI